MIDYSSLSDQDLISAGRQGDRLAEEELIRRYGQKVRICARHFFLLGGDDEDLLQEGMKYGHSIPHAALPLTPMQRSAFAQG